MTEQIIGNWKLSYMENKTAFAEGFSPKTGAEVSARLESVAATVPGNFELDFMREGKLPDLYYGTNVLLAQRLENLHLYYWTKFVYHNDCETEAQLVFKGIDTVAEIFLDGTKLGFAENMLHAHAFSLTGVADGEHDLLVHIFPTALYARQFDLPAMCRGLKYNSDSTEIRKAPYSSAGILCRVSFPADFGSRLKLKSGFIPILKILLLIRKESVRMARLI